MSKTKFKFGLDERALERVAREGIRREMEGSGFRGECPFCNGSIIYRLPETTCPHCGKTFAPRV